MKTVGVDLEILRQRFFTKTARDPKTGCLVWTGSKNGKGYGQVSIATSQPALAHRVAWLLENGEWPEPCALHCCDNPSCVEVAHLFLGTRAENNADMRRKGRNRYIPRRGEESSSAKLTWPLVAEIRASGESGAALARRLGVCRSTISQVRRHVIWRER